MTAPVIWIEGLIGSGKSSLAARIEHEWHVRVLREPVDENPYLKRFYMDPHRWAWPMQVYMLAERYALQRLASAEAFTGTPVVLDRGLPGDRVFARMLTESGHISELEWKTYERFYDIMTADLRPPSLLVFLDVEVSTALARIEQRGRLCERGISAEYLTSLRDGYEKLLAEFTGPAGQHAWTRGVTVLRVPWNTQHEIADGYTTICAHLREGTR